MRTTTEPRMSFVSLSLPLIPVACHASLFNSVIHALCKNLALLHSFLGLLWAWCFRSACVTLSLLFAVLLSVQPASYPWCSAVQDYTIRWQVALVL